MLSAYHRCRILYGTGRATLKSSRTWITFPNGVSQEWQCSSSLRPNMSTDATVKHMCDDIPRCVQKYSTANSSDPLPTSSAHKNTRPTYDCPPPLFCLFVPIFDDDPPYIFERASCTPARVPYPSTMNLGRCSLQRPPLPCHPHGLPHRIEAYLLALPATSLSSAPRHRVLGAHNSVLHCQPPAPLSNPPVPATGSRAGDADPVSHAAPAGILVPRRRIIEETLPSWP